MKMTHQVNHLAIKWAQTQYGPKIQPQTHPMLIAEEETIYHLHMKGRGPNHWAIIPLFLKKLLKRLITSFSNFMCMS